MYIYILCVYILRIYIYNQQHTWGMSKGIRRVRKKTVLHSLFICPGVADRLHPSPPQVQVRGAAVLLMAHSCQLP